MLIVWYQKKALSSQSVPIYFLLNFAHAFPCNWHFSKKLKKYRCKLWYLQKLSQIYQSLAFFMLFPKSGVLEIKIFQKKKLNEPLDYFFFEIIIYRGCDNEDRTFSIFPPGDVLYTRTGPSQINIFHGLLQQRKICFQQ